MNHWESITDKDILRDIQNDCIKEAKALDGRPFGGQTVGEQFGHILRMIGELARILEKRERQN